MEDESLFKRALASVGGKRISGILLCIIVISGFTILPLSADILIPMDNTQTNHLKAYGIAFAGLKEHLV